MQSVISHGYRRNIKNFKQYLMKGKRLCRKQGGIKMFFVTLYYEQVTEFGTHLYCLLNSTTKSSSHCFILIP